jgi:hypothetical protein
VKINTDLQITIGSSSVSQLGTVTRFSSRCVALDCAPATPSIRGSMTNVTLSGAPSRFAFESKSMPLNPPPTIRTSHLMDGDICSAL